MTSPSTSLKSSTAITCQRGLTIIELMVVVAIAAVLMAIAVPSFEESSTKSQIRKGVNNLLSDLAFARSVAITRSRSVSLCASDTTGVQQCGTGDWNEGWLAFIDSDEDGSLGAGEEVVRIGSAVGNRVAITLDNNVTFDSKGMNQTVSQFIICKASDSNARYARAVLVNLGGLVRGSRDSNGDGIHNSGEGGGNLSCAS